MLDDSYCPPTHIFVKQWTTPMVVDSLPVSREAKMLETYEVPGELL